MVYFKDVKDKVKSFSRMPLKYKKENYHVCALVDVPNLLLENELMQVMMQERIERYPFLYENTRFLLVEHL